MSAFACGNNVVNIILIVAVFKMGKWNKYIYFRAGTKPDKKGPKIYLFGNKKAKLAALRQCTWPLLFDTACSLEHGRAG